MDILFYHHCVGPHVIKEKKKKRMNKQLLGVWISLEKLGDVASYAQIPIWPHSAAAGEQLPWCPCPVIPLYLGRNSLAVNHASCDDIFFLKLFWTIATMTPRAQIYQPNVNPMIVFKYGTEEFQIDQGR